MECSHAVRLSITALFLLCIELWSEKICDPSDVSNNGQVTMEHSPQASARSSIPRLTTRAKQKSAAAVWIQIICSCLPQRVIFKMIGKTDRSIILAARDFNALGTARTVWMRKYSSNERSERPVLYCSSSPFKGSACRWEELKKKKISMNVSWMHHLIFYGRENWNIWEESAYFAMCCTNI